MMRFIILKATSSNRNIPLLLRCFGVPEDC